MVERQKMTIDLSYTTCDVRARQAVQAIPCFDHGDAFPFSLSAANQDSSPTTLPASQPHTATMTAVAHTQFALTRRPAAHDIARPIARLPFATPAPGSPQPLEHHAVIDMYFDGRAVLEASKRHDLAPRSSGTSWMPCTPRPCRTSSFS